MFKDYDKYLTTSLKVYLFVLIIIFILKMVGLDYFGLDVNNEILLKFNNFANKYNLINIWYFITLYIYTFCIVSVACNDQNIKIKTLIYTAIGTIIKIIESYYGNLTSTALIDIFYLYLICYINNKKYNWKNLFKRVTLIIILTMLYQLISAMTRVNDLNMYDYTFIQLVILDMDYIMLCLITCKVYFSERSDFKCITEVGFSSLKKVNLKNLLTKLQKNWHNFKKQDKVTKLTIIIYTIFSLIWNALSLVLILVVARLNDTFIECIFILTSFWLSKGKFGKPFHFKSMTLCFVVSNLSYYTLNRVTTPLGISIIIPVLLGVGLSYVTSKFVKKSYKPLYRGMPEELFEETIIKVTDKDSLKYKICYDFYIKKKSVVSLSIKYNYSEAGIRKIKDRINDKIKRLN